MQFGISTDGFRIEVVKFKDDSNIFPNNYILTNMKTTAHRFFQTPFAERKKSA